jgi:hypothetical protein
MRWRHRQATDPRDKIYALLGLLPDRVFSSAQSCNYSISVPKLFSKVTLDLLRSENGLRTLVASSELRHITPELPTWAIDFACSNIIGKRQLKWWNHSHRYRQFSACGTNQLQLETSAEDRIICLTGILVDEVSQVNDVYYAREDESIDGCRLLETIKSAEQLVHDNQRTNPKALPKAYPGRGRWKSAQWRTMVGDLVMDEFPLERAKSAHEADFENLCTLLAQGEQDFAPNILFESICGMIPNHAFFITKTGYIGIGPPNTQPGDQVWIFYGGKVPFIMRRSSSVGAKIERSGMQLIGDAYVHGIMDGEAVPDGHQAYQVTIH